MIKKSIATDRILRGMIYATFYTEIICPMLMLENEEN